MVGVSMHVRLTEQLPQDSIDHEVPASVTNSGGCRPILVTAFEYDFCHDPQTWGSALASHFPVCVVGKFCCVTRQLGGCFWRPQPVELAVYSPFMLLYLLLLPILVLYSTTGCMT